MQACTCDINWRNIKCVCILTVLFELLSGSVQIKSASLCRLSSFSLVFFEKSPAVAIARSAGPFCCGEKYGMRRSCVALWTNASPLSFTLMFAIHSAFLARYFSTTNLFCPMHLTLYGTTPDWSDACRNEQHCWIQLHRISIAISEFSTLMPMTLSFSTSPWHINNDCH